MAVQTTYKQRASSEYPHIEWLELHSDGVMHECAIMKRDRAGNVLFIRTNDLDEIDQRRLANILMDRNARGMELWDLMANKTLGNGMNALAYFNQLVKLITPNGKILDPKSGQIGVAPSGTVNTAPVVQ